MYKFIFRLQDGAKRFIENVEFDFVQSIWDNIDIYCIMFESESNKVKSVMQVKM